MKFSDITKRLSEKQKQRLRQTKTKEDLNMENTEKVKKLNEEELESVSGGRIIGFDTCPLCGSNYTSARIDGWIRTVCSNPECSNSRSPLAAL